MIDINVLYAGNRAVTKGILLSALSLVMKNKNNNINIYILTADFSDINPKYIPISKEDALKIEESLRKYNPRTNIYLLDNEKIINENHDNFKKLDNWFTPYSLLRLCAGGIDSLPSKILYLDSDTMVYNSLEDLFLNKEMDNYILGIVIDKMGKFWIRKDYFNSGVLFINLKKAREVKFFEEVFNLVKSRWFLFRDQSALNLIAKKYGYAYYLDGKYNEQRGMKKDTVVKHFCKGIKWFPFFHVYNIKQWEFEKVHKKLKIHEFDDVFIEFNKIEESFKKDDYILEIEHLVKTYGNLKAVNDISFKVKKGGLFAFLGINGAGKSTTINIICSILKKDSGRVIVCGYNLDNEKENKKIKEEIGIVFQNSVLDNDLTVIENLKIRTSFYSLTKEEANKKLERIVELLDLTPLLNRQVKKLSGGQKRRVDIARAMVHEPKLLILDEPTTGLDPKTRLSVWSLIDEIREKTGMTVFLTTHYLEEADQASYVVIMDKGNIIAGGTPNELKNKFSSDYVLAFLSKNDKFEEILKQNNEKFDYDVDRKAYKIYVDSPLKGKKLVDKYSEYIVDFELLKGNMDDVFLNVTGKNILLENGENNE